MEKTQTFQIADISAFAHRLPRLSEHNPDYDLTKAEKDEAGNETVDYSGMYDLDDIGVKIDEFYADK